MFTTHTPVPAGIDRFPADLVRRYFGGANGAIESAMLPGLTVDKILALGREDDPTVFNMAHMGLRLGQRANGVSKLHGVVSRGMFSGLWPGFDAAEVPIGSITNGVHAPDLGRAGMDRQGPRPRRRRSGGGGARLGAAAAISRPRTCGRRAMRCAQSW